MGKNSKKGKGRGKTQKREGCGKDLRKGMGVGKIPGKGRVW